MRTGTVSRALGLAGLALLLACAFTPLAPAIAGWLGSAPRIEPAEAIVVLGADVLPDGSLGGASLRRTIHGIRLYRRGLAPILIFSGSPARQGRPAEPAVRAALAEELGIGAPVVLTMTAWTTQEEAAHAAALLRPRGVRRILLVTESQHLVRAVGVFERAGFEVLPAPADGTPGAGHPEARLELTREILEELLARLLYRLRGSA